MSQGDAFKRTAKNLIHMASNAIEEAAAYIDNIEDDEVKEALWQKLANLHNELPTLIPVNPVFTVGTTVRFTDVGASHISAFDAGDIGIITEVSSDDGYAVNGCAWYSSDDFEWVADPTLESMKQVSILSSKGDEEEELDGEED